jgi:hypothetical protein
MKVRRLECEARALARPSHRLRAAAALRVIKVVASTREDVEDDEGFDDGYSSEGELLGGLISKDDNPYVTSSAERLRKRYGEYRVTATVAATSIVRTALVLQDVHADWGQPQSVAGLVNTDGYEDGVTIAPDGQTLFVQYGPYRWSSLLVFQESRANGGCGGNRLVPDRCTHPWLDTTMLSQFSTRQQLVDACMASAHGAPAASGCCSSV